MHHESTMTQDSSANLVFDIPLKMPAKTDIKIAARSPETNAIVNCSFEGWLENN